MWLIKVFSVIYFTAVCAAQDEAIEDVTAVMGYPTTPQPKPTTAYVPPVPSLQLQSPWLDVFPLEEVQFNCSVAGSSDWTFTWYRDDNEVQDSDPNVSLPAKGSVLVIHAATQAYSGSYSCKGHHNTKGVTTAASKPLQLTVYANEPKATLTRSLNFDKVYPGESITFRCSVGVSSGWEYLWYHDGNEIKAANSNEYKIAPVGQSNSGQYYCKAKRGKGPFFTEESEKRSLQVSDPPKPSMRLLTPWTGVFENETVDFLCQVDGDDWTFTWYKNQQQVKEGPDVEFLDAELPWLNITSISPGQEGGYSCKVHLEARGVSSEYSNTVNITVYDDIPRPTQSKYPGFNPMYVGETVNFTCSVDVSSGWEYRWYKDGVPLHDTGKTISVHLGPSSRGKYYCKASRGETTSTDRSEKIQQDVLEIPVPSSALLTPWADVFPTESVKLSCGMSDGSDWTYTWYKDGHKVQADDDTSLDSTGATLSIKSASPGHAGQYSCKGQLQGRSVISSSSSELKLTVHDRKPSVTMTQDPSYELMFPGESVSFSCHIDVFSGWEYLWFKDEKRLNVTGNKHTISPVETIHRGSYKCQGRRGTNQVFHTSSSEAIQLKVEENKPKPTMTQQSYVDKVYTGESVSLECKVEPLSSWQYMWYKDGKPLPISGSSFNIHNANLSDAGKYKCMARRNKTMYTTELSDGLILHIFEIPVPSSAVTTTWLDVFPTESVKMSCGISDGSAWTYTWYKDGREVQADDATFFDSATTLLIKSASAAHAGRYNCKGQLQGRSVSSSFSNELTLHVYKTKPEARLMQNPSDNVMHTGDQVSFSCHINVSSGWDYLWYKDGRPLAESRNIYNITSALTKSSGSYECQTKRGENTVFKSNQSHPVKLHIEERPKADIVLLTGWSDVFSTDSLVLQCDVEGDKLSWNYTWSKEGRLIDLPPSQKHTVTPQNDPEQSTYTCRAISTSRPYHSKDSDQFHTKNLLLKRRVLLSISGCIVFGIVAVFLGCVVLRVVRKPAQDEYKPEEAELFLSMAQLKDRDDTPCPLVQYITDAALNSPSKEGDENGTISSETTPLPISPQEEAVTTENHDTAENNGGLVSFKQ